MVMRTLSRRELQHIHEGILFGGNRDLYKVFGYPTDLDIKDYRTMYERNGLAGRIIDAYPDATWSTLPNIEPEGPVQVAYDTVEKNYHVMSVFHRLDRLVQLGRYGVLHIGFDDTKTQDTPLERGSASKVLYLQPHGEDTAQVSRWVTNPNSPRYGHPEMYQLTKQMGDSQATRAVHASRVLHVAEDTLEDPYIGLPRLRRVYNHLLDLMKVVGSSAETFWINAALFVAFVADSEVQWDPSEKADVRQQLEDFKHGLDKYLRLRGVDPKVLSTPIADPRPHFDVLAELIVAGEGIPKRIIFGSERGEMASSQDEHNWISRNKERRQEYAIPSIVQPFVRKLQFAGVIPEGDFEVVYEEADMLGPDKRADIAVKKTTALRNYTQSPGAEEIISPEVFATWLDEEAVEPELYDV
jgi:uncharacterized protein